LIKLEYHDLIETFGQQDVNLVRVFEDVAVFNAHDTGPAHMENMAGLACRSALSKRGVAHLSMSNDVQEERLDAASDPGANVQSEPLKTMMNGKGNPI